MERRESEEKAGVTKTRGGQKAWGGVNGGKRGGNFGRGAL